MEAVKPVTFQDLFVINSGDGMVGTLIGKSVHTVQQLSEGGRKVTLIAMGLGATLSLGLGMAKLLSDISLVVTLLAAGVFCTFVALSALASPITWSKDFPKIDSDIEDKIQSILLGQNAISKGFLGTNFESKEKGENLSVGLGGALPVATDVQKAAIIRDLRKNPILHVPGDKKDLLFGIYKSTVYEINLLFMKIYVLGAKQEGYIYLLKEDKKFVDMTNDQTYFSVDNGASFYKELFNQFLLKSWTEIPGQSYVVRSMSA